MPFAPNPLDENKIAPRAKWDNRYAHSHPTAHVEPAPLLTQWLPKAPAQGRALDIAAGAGRHSLALAQHGLTVHALDISAQGLNLLRQKMEPGLSIQPLIIDLERGWLPRGNYAVIVNFFYLERRLWPAIQKVLEPGGWFIMETFTLEQRTLPNKGYIRPEFLLYPGELRAAFSALQIIHYAEGLHNGRYTAQLVGRNKNENSNQ